MHAVANAITLTGKVEKVIFHNPDNGYSVLHILAEAPHNKVVVVGNFSQVFVGAYLSLQGVWQQHPTHGQQLAARSYTLQTPPAESGTQKFLIQYLEGVDKATLKKLQDAFGEDLVDVLNHKPERLREVSGIGKKRYKNILQSWDTHKGSHEVMVYLTSLHVSYPMAIRIYKRYGPQTLTKVKTNPYQIIEEIEGFTFEMADNIARQCAIEPSDLIRLRAGLWYVLQKGTQYGHCGMENTQLLRQAAVLLREPMLLLEETLEAMIAQKTIIQDTVKSTDCVFVPELWEQEKLIAEKLKELLATPIAKKNKKQPALLKTLQAEIKKEALTLSEEQNAAIEQALASKVFVITGGPGVGKTTILRLLANVFKQSEMRVLLGAPTGRAAKRLSEVTRMPAKTIHRLLEYDPFSETFGFNSEKLLNAEVVIIDEASMLDVPLCAAILEALPYNARIYFVGDVDQLPSVGPGDVLSGCIHSGKIPYYLLQTIFRQQASSQIIINAHRVNQGLMPVVDPDLTPDFYLVGAPNIEEQQSKIVTIVSERLGARFGFHPLEDIQVLSPMNEGPLGVNILNQLLQEALNPASVDTPQMAYRGGVFREGDKVIQIINDYDKNVFNGDIGRISAVHVGAKKIEVLFDQQKIEYPYKELEQLRLAYAISIHKSQGSEYPAVVVVLSLQQKMMLKRNLLYTAISRGKSCVVIVGASAAVQCAVNTKTVSTRIHKLEEWLQHDDAKCTA